MKERESSPTCITVVVSYNSARDLPRCLTAIQEQENVRTEVFVVDNASHDGSGDLVRSRFPSVTLIENTVNVGFARANNQILEHTPADYVALVNPDAVLAPGAIAERVSHLRQDPTVGVASTRLVNPDGTLQPSCHAYLGLMNLLGETFMLDHLFPNWKAISSLHMTDFAHDRPADVEWIQGAFLVVRGDVCRQVGGFDPDFFMYGEEMDWCYRIHKAGWRIVYLPDPPVVHEGGASSRPIAGPMFVENLKSRLRFLDKHRGPLVTALARAIIAVSVLLRALARELLALVSRVLGRRISESLDLRLAMFRAATRWVLRGLPIEPASSPTPRA